MTGGGRLVHRGSLPTGDSDTSFSRRINYPQFLSFATCSFMFSLSSPSNGAHVHVVNIEIRPYVKQWPVRPGVQMVERESYAGNYEGKKRGLNNWNRLVKRLLTRG